MTPEEEAKDPTTKPERLKALYQEDFRLRPLLASNPNTPHPLFKVLAEEYPEEVFQNTSFQLMFLETPNALETFPATAVRALAQIDSLPEWFIILLASFPDLKAREVLIKRREVTPEILERLAGHHNINARKAAALSPRTPFQALQRLFERHKDTYAEIAQNPNTLSHMLHKLCFEGPHVARKVASHPNTTPATIATLLAYQDPLINREVAGNPSTPPYILEKLAKSKDKETRNKALTNPSTPTNVLETYAKYDDIEERCRVAQNPSMPLEVLELLFQDANYHVQASIALNPKAPVNMLEAISNYADPRERANVAKNPSTPLALLEKLSYDSHSDVRYAVAQNLRTPIEHLQRLSADEDKHVQRAARTSLQQR